MYGRAAFEYVRLERFLKAIRRDALSFVEVLLRDLAHQVVGDAVVVLVPVRRLEAIDERAEQCERGLHRLLDLVLRGIGGQIVETCLNRTELVHGVAIEQGRQYPLELVGIFLGEQVAGNEKGFAVAVRDG